MIPRAFVTHWRNHAPWLLDEQVEQDLVISRALVELFCVPEIAANLAFRGGTALHKLHLSPAARYSEDVDLVQMTPGPIGPILDCIRAQMDPWLGPVKNTREPFTKLGVIDMPYKVESPWFNGDANLRSFALEELLGTKLRALYQRRKGRDVFDLAHALDLHPQLDRQEVVDCFTAYMSRSGAVPRRTEFEANLADKRSHRDFMNDMRALLHPRYGRYEPEQAITRIEQELISRLS